MFSVLCPSRHTFCVMAWATLLSTSVFAQCPNHFHIKGTRQQFALVSMHGFPFLRGSVDGIYGNFMFDTGSKRTLALNDHLLNHLGPGKPLGASTVQSGQIFLRTLHPCVRSIQLQGAAAQRNLSDVESNNLSFMEHLTPGFLGVVGFGAFDEYAFKLDYQRKQITFYDATRDPMGIKDALSGEKVLASIPFHTRELPNHPIFEGSLGGVAILLTLDSGQGGLLNFDQGTRDALMSQGVVARTDQEAIPERYEVRNLQVAPGLNISQSGLQLADASSAANKAIGIADTPSITLGFKFFEHFTTIWDFPHHMFYVLQQAP